MSASSDCSMSASSSDPGSGKPSGAAKCRAPRPVAIPRERMAPYQRYDHRNFDCKEGSRGANGVWVRREDRETTLKGVRWRRWRARSIMYSCAASNMQWWKRSGVELENAPRLKTSGLAKLSIQIQLNNHPFLTLLQSFIIRV